MLCITFARAATRVLGVGLQLEDMPPGEHEHADEASILDHMIILKIDWELVNRCKDDVEVLVGAGKRADEDAAIANGDPKLFSQQISQIRYSCRVLFSITLRVI